MSTPQLSTTVTKPKAFGSTAFVGVTTLVYLITKATAFFGPMMLARSLGVDHYGEFELALAWGTPCAVLAGMGLTASVPYFLLKLDKPESRSIFYLHVMWVSAVLAIAALLVHWHGDIIVSMALLITGIFAGQNIFSAMLKTYAQPAASSFLEVALYCVLFVYLLVFLALRRPLSMELCYAAILGTAVLFIVASAWLWLREPVRAPLGPIYSATVKFGLPVIVTSLLNTVLLSGGRILLGVFVGVRDVGIFSLLFRMSAAAVVVHQLLVSIIFPKLYKGNERLLDRYLFAIQSIVLSAALSVWLVGWPIGQHLFPALRGGGNIHEVMLVVSLQMFFWCSSSQVEFILYREELANHYAVWLCTAFALLIGGSYALSALGWASLMSLTRWQMVVMCIKVIGDMMLLRRGGIKLRLPVILNAGVFAVYWIVAGVQTYWLHIR
jgi:O-antigen/teichoic acid export membrane protein